MRYPGEWKFPGGAVETGDQSLKHAALRELNEEFLGIDARNDESILHERNEKMTKSIQGKRFRMHNFVAFEEDNSWLRSTELVATVNCKLEERRLRFRRSIDTGKFWTMPLQERMYLSPEIYRIRWVDLEEAIQIMASSLSKSPKPIDSWQSQQFQKYHITERDPMFQSMKILEEIRDLRTKRKIIANSKSFSLM